jgi:hypothetical protein
VGGLRLLGNDGLLGTSAGVATGRRLFWVVVLDLLLLVGFISAGKRTEE